MRILLSELRKGRKLVFEGCQDIMRTPPKNKKKVEIHASLR